MRREGQQLHACNYTWPLRPLYLLFLGSLFGGGVVMGAYLCPWFGCVLVACDVLWTEAEALDVDVSCLNT
jgi:hypothetical protein